MFNIFRNLDPNTSILLCGCGGGYDIFCGLPLYFNLNERFKNIYLTNFSFTEKEYLEKYEKIGNSCYIVDGTVTFDIDNMFFPEHHLAKELNIIVYAFVDNGMNAYHESIQSLTKTLNTQLIILCDGGCDSIMTGLEPNLATPVEDLMTMMVVNKLGIQSYLLLLGASVDTYVEIHRSDFIWHLQQLWCKDLLKQYQLTLNNHVQRYINTFEKCFPRYSIVNSSIIAHLQNQQNQTIPRLLYDDEGIPRCDNNEDFILDHHVTTYYLFDLKPILNRISYIDLIKDLDDSDDIDDIITSINNYIWPKSEYDKSIPYIKQDEYQNKISNRKSDIIVINNNNIKINELDSNIKLTVQV